MKQEQFATVFEELGLTSDQIDEYMEHWNLGRVRIRVPAQLEVDIGFRLPLAARC